MVSLGAMVRVPSETGWMPSIALISVVFPAPLGADNGDDIPALNP